MIKEQPIETISDTLVRYEQTASITNPMIVLAITGREIAEKKSVIEIGDRLKQYHNEGTSIT